MTQPSRIDGLPDLPKPHAAFEAKMIEDGYTLDFFRNHGSDRYCYMETEWAFRGYEAGSAAAAQAAKQVPEGWVPCTITYAEGEDPEEVAFGPQRMMDRLKKWLDSYFAKVYAERYPIATAPSATSLAEAAEAGQVEAGPMQGLAAWLRCMARNAIDQDTILRWADEITALAATPASPQAPAPQAGVGEASESALGPLDQLP